MQQSFEDIPKNNYLLQKFPGQLRNSISVDMKVRLQYAPQLVYAMLYSFENNFFE